MQPKYRVVLSYLRNTRVHYLGKQAATTEPKVYVDFNEVLADLKSTWNSILPDYKSDWPLFWKKLKERPSKDIADKMVFYPGGKELWAKIKAYKPEILTGGKEGAPGWYIEKSKIIKELWSKKNLGPGITVNQTPGGKDEYAVQNGIPNILIDDSAQKLKKWEAAGGIGIHHTGNANQTVLQLQKVLNNKSKLANVEDDVEDPPYKDPNKVFPGRHKGITEEEKKLYQSELRGKTLMTLPGGWKWVQLSPDKMEYDAEKLPKRGYWKKFLENKEMRKGTCPIEAELMGQCGNIHQFKSGDTLISLRDKDNKPHVLLTVNNGYIKNSFGRFNTRPHKKFHDAIVDLLKSSYIKGIHNDRVLKNRNFHLSDLSDQSTIEKLKTEKPDLWTEVDDLRTKTKEDFIKNKSNEELVDILNKDYDSWGKEPKEDLLIAITKNKKDDPDFISLFQKRYKDKEWAGLALLNNNILPEEDIQIETVRKVPDYLKQIVIFGKGNPSENVQLEAVKKDGKKIQYITNPSEKVINEALTNNPEASKFIHKQV